MRFVNKQLSPGENVNKILFYVSNQKWYICRKFKDATQQARIFFLKKCIGAPNKTHEMKKKIS